MFRASDGTSIAHYAAGLKEGPCLIISSGLGGGHAAWKGIVDRFAETMRIVIWDYRGLYASSPAADGRSYGMSVHARDLSELIDALEIEHPILVGWSMGVQVNFELLRLRPGLARGLVALHGTYRFPLNTAFNGRMPAQVPPLVFGAVRRCWRPFAPIISRAGRTRPLALMFMRNCQRLGLMSRAMDHDMFYEMAREWVDLDLRIYSDIFEALGRHDLSKVLPNVRVPCLVVAGEDDVLTPPELSEAMVDHLPAGELVMLPRCTHFGPLEHPTLIADRMHEFFQQRLAL